MDIQYIHSDLLDQAGVKHGWFLRYGGVSNGLFESLNGKKNNGDKNTNVDENGRRALKAIGRDEKSLTHIIHAFKDNLLEAAVPGEFKDYDAVLTTSNKLTLSQTTADCGSIVLASTDNKIKIVALIHGSWRTLSTPLISKVITRFSDLGVTPQDIVVGIGPMICKKCYEFGPEAKDLFDPKYLQQKNDKYLIDLKLIATDQLKAMGIIKIDDCNICTKEDERFFSHRRDGAKSGRMLTLAALPDVI